MEDLKNCPLCNGKARIWVQPMNEPRFGICCEKCQLCTNTIKDKEQLINHWNGRAELLTLQDRYNAQEKLFRQKLDDIQTLWMLLDDIDTLDDAAKDNDSAFRKACYEIQQKRWFIKDPFSMELTQLKAKEA